MGVFKSINEPKIEGFSMNFTVFKAILLWATIHVFTLFWETIWIQRLYVPIYFGRFDSEIANLKKIHANVHTCASFEKYSHTMCIVQGGMLNWQRKSLSNLQKITNKFTYQGKGLSTYHIGPIGRRTGCLLNLGAM